MPYGHAPFRVISGGQTGVDRAALDAAIALGIEHGGKCPRGRRAEDGEIPAKYQLSETESKQYKARTKQNVLDADGTLIVYAKELTGGTALTKELAQKHDKPYFLYDLESPPAWDELREWLSKHFVNTLNCAGPRESSNPGIGERAQGVFEQLFLFAAALRR